MGARLPDRLTARSLDAMELHEVRARSGADMKRDLTWWDLAWFGVGAGIFVLTGQEARDTAGPAVVVSYVVSGISAMLSVFCYTEFAVEIPVAGGNFKPKKEITTRLVRFEKKLLHGCLQADIQFINDLPDHTVSPCPAPYAPELK